MNKKTFNSILIISSLFIICFSGFLCFIGIQRQHNTEYVWCIETISIYDVYHATAPFGILYKDEQGSVLGWSTSLSETIIVKYLDGNELKTVSTDHPFTDIRIVVDGRLVIERQKLYREEWVFGKLKQRKEYSTAWKRYVLHIPRLPEPHYNETRNYVVIS